MQSDDGNVINITYCGATHPAIASMAIRYSVARAAINELTKYLVKHCSLDARVISAIAPC